MCFSAEADLIAGVVVTGVGVDALRHVTDRRQLGVAALPVVFGVHQLIETLAWWGADGRVPECVADGATWGYLAIAFVLPLLVPLAMRAFEPDPERRRWMTPCALLGGVISAVLLAELLSGPVTATVSGAYIAYDVDLDHGGHITALYVVATCVPMLLSSTRRIVVYGVLNLAAVSALGWLLAGGVISLWCAWAAVTSVMIAVQLRSSSGRHEGDPAEPVSVR